MAADRPPKSHAVFTSGLNRPIRYPSRPLRPDLHEIRLLHLMPGEPNEQILCQLEIIALPDHPQYEALSYTWGTLLDPRTITLDDELDFQITRNLHAALRSLRLVDQVRILWVDAVCVNQHDVQERNSQLSLMRRVYQSASSVLIWLGDGGNTGKRLRASTPRHRDEEAGSQEQTEAHAMSRPLRVYPEEWELDLTGALMATDPHWWERVWVVQEFALATQAPRICFGQSEVELRVFQRSLQSLIVAIYDAVADPPGSSAPHMHGLRLLKLLESLNAGLKQFATFRECQTLSEIIMATQTLDASDARDKVYSLLGMISAEQSEQIPLNHEDTFAQVCQQATICILSTEGTLAILCLVAFGVDESNDTASWVANFDRCGAKWGHNPEGLDSWLTLTRPLWHSLFMGLPAVPGTPNFSLPDKVRRAHLEAGQLVMTGKPVGSVTRTRAIPAHLVEAMHVLLNTIRDGTVSRDSATSMTNDERIRLALHYVFTELEDISAKVTLQQIERSRAASTETRDLTKTDLCVHPPAFLAFAFSGIAFPPEETAYDPPRFYTSPVRKIERWLQYATFASGSATLFSTLEGPIGLGTSAICPSDQIVALADYPHFAVLRPTTRGYIFRGFAYLHGSSGTESQSDERLAPHLLETFVVV